MSVTINDAAIYSEVSNATTTYGGADLDQETFLNLLITQLQNQDPMNPQESQEFVAQLAQFSSLEQLMTLNDGMDTLYLATSSMNNASMTQLIGKEVVAYGDSFSYDGEGEVELMYDATGEASQATLNITDEDGNVVASIALGALSEGEATYTWDGKTTSGATAEEGVYSFEIDATDTDGDAVTVYSMVSGVVDTMNYESGTPVPEIDGVEIELGEIIRVVEHSDSAEQRDEDEQEDPEIV
jgi:flagellar basal-body rod modification protein FlgD